MGFFKLIHRGLDNFYGFFQQQAAFLPTVMTRGPTVWEAPSAFAKKRFAA
jgi:hypothetical protein